MNGLCLRSRQCLAGSGGRLVKCSYYLGSGVESDGREVVRGRGRGADSRWCCFHLDISQILPMCATAMSTLPEICTSVHLYILPLIHLFVCICCDHWKGAGAMSDSFKRENINVHEELHRGPCVHVCLCLCVSLFTHWACLHAHIKPGYWKIRLRQETGEVVHILKTLHTAGQLSHFNLTYGRIFEPRLRPHFLIWLYTFGNWLLYTAFCLQPDVVCMSDKGIHSCSNDLSFIP